MGEEEDEEEGEEEENREAWMLDANPSPSLVEAANVSAFFSLSVSGPILTSPAGQKRCLVAGPPPGCVAALRSLLWYPGPSGEPGQSTNTLHTPLSKHSQVTNEDKPVKKMFYSATLTKTPC